jgi:hypothetical protein
MAKVFRFTAKYGQAKSFEFTADAPLTSGARQVLISGGTGPVTADITGSKDGAGPAALTGVITNPGVSWIYVYAASAADLQCDRSLVVKVSDAGAALYDDVTLVIHFTLELSQFSVDPTSWTGNRNGIESKGLGAGHGYSGTAGASGKICNFFDTVLGTEAATAYNALTSTIKDAIQKVAARFYKRVVTNTTQQIVYKEDGTTAVDTMTITASGSSVDKGAAS